MNNSNNNISNGASHWRCHNVLYQGNKATLELTQEKLRFGDQISWRLCDLQGNSTSAVTCTIKINLLDSFVAFQMESLADLVKFRKELVLRQCRHTTTSSDQTASKEFQLAQKDLAERQHYQQQQAHQSDAAEATKRRTSQGKLHPGTRRNDDRKSLDPGQSSENKTTTTTRGDEKSKKRPLRRNNSFTRSPSCWGSDSEEEIRDDLIAREILEMTAPQAVGPMDSSSKSTQSAPEPPQLPDTPVTSCDYDTDDRALKARAVAIGIVSNDERLPSSISNKLNKDAMAIYKTECSPSDMKTDTFRDEESPESPQDQQAPPRPPGAYRRCPGKQSIRANGLSRTLIGQLEAWADSSSHSQEDTTMCTSGWSGSFRQMMEKTTMVTASLVEDTAEVRISTVVPSAVEIDQSDTKTFTRGVWCGFLLVTAVVVAAIVTIVLVVSMNAQESNGLAVNEHDNHLNRLEGFHKMAAFVSLDAAALDDPNSPVSLAREWMIKHNNHLDPTDEHQHSNVLQRYVLAFFYFHTSRASQGGWKHCNPPQTGEKDACRHKLLESYGVEGVYFDQYMVENSFRWLSSAHECQWAGVSCDEDYRVISLQLGDYGLSGSFPAELVHLPHLQVIDLQQNNLDSTLPPEFGLGAKDHFQHQLQVLRLDRNKLTGSIPEEWCLLCPDTLEELNLGGNQLTGSLPSCLGDLKQLQDFSVLGNQLTGAIPEELGDCTHLERFHFANNRFVGSIPKGICEAKFLTELSADCLDNNDGQFQECSCCTKCCDPATEICELMSVDKDRDGGN